MVCVNVEISVISTLLVTIIISRPTFQILHFALRKELQMVLMVGVYTILKQRMVAFCVRVIFIFKQLFIQARGEIRKRILEGSRQEPEVNW